MGKFVQHRNYVISNHVHLCFFGRTHSVRPFHPPHGGVLDLYRLFVRKLAIFTHLNIMCKRSKYVVTGIDYETNTALYLDTQCKSYSCEVCADCIRKLHQARIIYATKEYEAWTGLRWSFVTLTSHEKAQTFETSLALFQNALPKWRKRMKRRYGDFGYVLVFEQHKSKSLHAHMLINAPVSKKWVRRHARSVGLGYMADVQHLHAAAAAGKYCSKYISKSLADTNFPKRFKRVRYSHNWPELPKSHSSIRHWLAVRHSDVWLHVLADIHSGLSVRVDDRIVGRALSTEQFELIKQMRVRQ